MEHFRHPIDSAKLEISRHNAIQFSDTLLVIKGHNNMRRVLSDGTVVSFGEKIGNMHVRGVTDDEEVEDMSPVIRGRKFLRETVKGLVNLSEACIDNQEYVKGITAFKGVSDVLRPQLLAWLGFPEDNLFLHLHQSKMTKEIQENRKLSYPQHLILQKNKAIYEWWVTRDELSSSLPRLLPLYLSV